MPRVDGSWSKSQPKPTLSILRRLLEDQGRISEQISLFSGICIQTQTGTFLSDSVVSL